MADSDRVAELKRKMQEAALRAKAEAAASEDTAAPAPKAAPQAAAPAAVVESAPAQAEAAAAPSAATVVVSEAPAAEVEAVAAPVEPTPAEAAASVAAAPQTKAVATPAAAATNGSSNGVNSSASYGANSGAGALDDTTYVPQVLSPEELAHRDMNRREFLTYAWGGALLLVAGATGVGLFQFLYPRFKAGEFGGEFILGPVAALPSTDAPPEGITAGKFWLVNTTDEGVKALYMVCTHLGCLYKWEPSTVRFECPCHGSMFSREGYYIKGPAPRSLDRFETSEVGGELVVDTGAKIIGSPAGESPARAEV